MHPFLANWALVHPSRCLRGQDLLKDPDGCGTWGDFRIATTTCCGLKLSTPKYGCTTFWKCENFSVSLVFEDLKTFHFWRFSVFLVAFWFRDLCLSLHVFARHIACGFLVGMLPRTPLIIFISQDFIKTKVSKNLSKIRNERCNQLTLPKFNSSFAPEKLPKPNGKVFQPPFLMGYVKLGYGFSNTDIDGFSFLQLRLFLMLWTPLLHSPQRAKTWSQSRFYSDILLMEESLQSLINNGIIIILGGAGFCPSTVSSGVLSTTLPFSLALFLCWYFFGWNLHFILLFNCQSWGLGTPLQGIPPQPKPK